VTRRFKLRRRRAVALALSAGVLAIAAPTAAETTSDDPAPPSSIAASAADEYQDLRSPDVRDSALAAQQQARSSGDLRSPDARDAALASQQQARSEIAQRDLRSPDARDAALGTTTGSQPTSTPAPVETPTVIAVEESGSHTLAIVFSAIALVIALLALGFTALVRRPRPRWTAP
jgi:hypothetical protein